MQSERLESKAQRAMDDTLEGIVFNIQRYSIDDGPGVRTTVFVKGCPLSCVWCSNPESLDPRPEVTYRYTRCKRCGTCVEACPNGLITLDEEGIHIDRRRCQRCGTCVSVCPPQALRMSGKKMSVAEVFKVVERDTDYYEASGGGMTCSGGEILGQPEFVARLLRRCREAGIHTCADTSGWGSREAMLTILEQCDLVYFDLKHMDADEHLRMCGRSNEVILKNLAVVVEKGVPVVLRVPLIPGYTDADENIAAVGRVAARLAKEAPIQILPYHRYGASKYRALDRKYAFEGVEGPAPQDLDRAKRIIESFGPKCEIMK